MMSLREIWALHDEASEVGLETSIGYHSGVEFLLNSDKITGKRLFLVKFPSNINVDSFVNVRFRSLVVQMLDFSLYKELTFLILKSELAEIFISFAEDLLFQTSRCKDPLEVLNTVSKVISQWLKLFERAGSNLLSSESEKGLFGELYFFRTLLNEGYPIRELEVAWEGPLWADKDFTFPTAKFEVKFSSAKHASLKISSERQLEVLDDEREFIVLYVATESRSVGESLTDLIRDIRSIVSSDMPTLELLNEKILSYGYAEDDHNAYDKKFTVRHVNIFRITGDFPSITPKRLLAGVFNVNYEIELAACEPYKIFFSSVTEIINGY
jgi:hypothetical protein